jgi:glycosyltransferase involved in cell wall biosynthesis
LGLPIVSTNVGGIPELLVNTEEGLLVHCGDSYAMAGAILEIFEDPEAAAKMGARARLRGRKRNDLKSIISRLLKIYEQITVQAHPELMTDKNPENKLEHNRIKE